MTAARKGWGASIPLGYFLTLPDRALFAKATHAEHEHSGDKNDVFLLQTRGKLEIKER